MRRGHQGFEGWRTENPRIFRQRNSSNPPFRSQRNFNQHNSRFAPRGLRPPRPHYNSYIINNEHITEDHEWTRYSQDLQFSFSRTKDQTSFQKSYPKQIKPGDNYKDSFHNSEGCSINNMGDVDQRQIHLHRNHPIRPWNSDIDEQTYSNTYKENPHHYNKQHPNYAGHRPPASDHYGGNPIPTNEKSKTFSRSVDDTVNIVRRRLLNREETPQAPCNEGIKNSVNMYENLKVAPSSSQYDQNLIKKKAPRARKVNCERIKNKIFNQLFKMDKEKIHKLLDNPSSSSKFEYALNSLLTESQNSFNQHMRSVAEKSLCSSSKEFMQNDNNTIYEDTFLKQMQCILDPQDTVLLEDIKPVVMAELNNLLQFDEIDNRCSYDNRDNLSYFNEKRIEEENPQDFHDYPSLHNTYLNKSKTDNCYENFSPNYSNINNYEAFENTKHLFERRVQRKSATNSPTTDIGHNTRPHTNDTEWRSTCSEGDFKEKDDYPNDEPSKTFDHDEPVFDANAEFTEDEDTFAELDRQYHVIVDHDFIKDDELSNPIQELHKTQQESKVNTSINSIKSKDEINELKLSEKNEKEIVSQLQDFASKKLESFIIHDTEVRNDKTSSYDQNSETTLVVKEEAQENQSNNMEIKNKNDEFIHSEITIPSSNSRKRSTDQRPSHRKEKRKKSKDRDSKNKSQEKMLSYKRTPMSTSSNNYEKIICDDLKNCREPTQSKEKSSHSDNKEQSPCDKNNSEKYIKEKDPIKTKPCEDRKRQNSTSSNHSISPKNISAQPSASTKADSKCSLTSIDMFTEMPKKINTHQAFRNTALSKTPKKIDQFQPNSENILNQRSKKKLELSHVAKSLLSKETQTVKHSFKSRFCQTAKINCVTRAIQVNLQPNNENKKNNPTDALERMKQIDLEIQELLQEKFKLYSSLEKKEGTSYIPMQNLGMTVLNVNSFEDNIESNENNDIEDTIVNNFTNIPVEELEQIALETEEIYSISPTRSNRRQKRNISSKLQFEDSPYEKKNNKSNTLNFSLIEQIITDDRPLEDIVSLDDLETTPNKLKKKQRRIRKTPKKAANTKKKNSPIPDSIHLKQCYVLLLREDLNKYINGNKLIIKENCINQRVEEAETHVIPTDLLDDRSNLTEEVEETVISSDIQFDMLDVSEDIVIGEVFEEKLTGEKLVPICEEIILDNSQSSIEEVTTPAETQGGECKLYDYLADENLQQDSLVASGNADAILAIEGIGSNFLAAGLDGNVYYFNSDGQLISTLRGSNLAVTCLCIVKEKNGTTVYTGSLDSRIRNYDLETGLEKGPECNVLSPIQTMDRAWDTVFVGTKTGFVLQFECKNNLLIPVSTVKFSDQSILALRAMKEGPRKVLLVAARSENVTIKDAQTGLLLRTLNGPKMTVYTLLYEDGKVYCGTSTHQIYVFDYTSGSHVGTHEGGKGAICLRAAGGLLFAGCYDGCVYVYREGEPRPFAQLRGPSLMLLCLSIVGTKIIAGFKDRSLYIWKIPLSILQEMIL